MLLDEPFAAVDPATGGFLPIAAPVLGQDTVKVATIDAVDDCTDGAVGGAAAAPRSRRRLGTWSAGGTYGGSDGDR